jgi:hypothetical protein
VAHLHALVRLRSDADKGTALLEMAPNDGAAIMVEFNPSRANGVVTTAWNTVGIIHGYRKYVATGPSIEVRDDNYASYRGVRGGEGTLTFKVEQYDGASVESVTVLDDSGVEYTPVGPGRLDARLTPPRRRQHEGKPFAVGYHVWRIDGRPPEQTRVTLMSDARNVRVSPRTRDL